MLHLVIGTPDSGKSRLAEQMVCENSLCRPVYYIATMIPYGEEGQKRIDKHRELRTGKGFITIECPYDIVKALEQIAEPSESVILLECMSNLVANEMFERKKNAGDIQTDIHRQVSTLNAAVAELYVVSNEFCTASQSDLISDYDEETKEYIRVTSLVNVMLKEMTTDVTEIKK